MVAQFSFDPAIGRWATGLIYLFVSIGCWRSARKPANGTPSPELHLWRAIAALFFAVCISNQLGLDTALTEAGRKLASSEGWYDQRQRVQLGFIVLVATLCIIAEIILLIWCSRNASLCASFAVVGTTFVIAYLMIRAASFDPVDQLIDERIFGLHLNWILQMSGVGVVLMASAWQNRWIGWKRTG
jgi:hypothetical protein